MVLHKGDTMANRKGIDKAVYDVTHLKGDASFMDASFMAEILGLDKSYDRKVCLGDSPNTCNVQRRSPVTGDWNEMILGVTAMRVEGYFTGLDNRLIQEQFPELSKTEREFLMTGMTSQDWEDTFCKDDETKCQHCGGPNH